MKKNRSSKDGIFNPRFGAAFLLCSAGVLLAMLAFAAPTSGKRSTTQNSGPSLKPTVFSSAYNGVSLAVRDLPIALPTAPRVEKELPPVHPNVPVPTGFVDPAVQAAAGPLAAPTPIANFEGQSANDSGCSCIPPDPNGAVGPSQYVQMVNSVFSVYSKSGTRLSGPTQINSLFQTLPPSARCHIDNNGDPIVVYDRIADRWLLSQFAINGGTGPSDECIAISQTPDATGAYFIYDFPLSTTKFEDYPHFGLWPDAYYMSTHEFSFASGNPYLSAGAWAFERDKMLVGQPARLVYFKLGPGSPAETFFGGQLPSSLDGANLPPTGSPNYFVEVDAAADNNPDAPGSLLRIWKFHVDWSNPANSTFGDANGLPNSRTAVMTFARPSCMNYASGCVPQAGDSFQLDPIGDRIMHRNAYRNFGDHESLVLNHTVVSNGTTGQMGPRWYEVRDPGGTPTIYQQSTWGPTSMTDLLYRWMSSMAMDASGDIAIGYSTSNQTNFPSIAYAGRLAGDPLNTLTQSETQLFAGTGPERGELFAPQFGRWGDYTAMQIDPTDDCTFWYTNEYFAATDAPTGIWHTRIGSFKFPQCVTPVLPQLISVVSEKTHTGVGPFDINLPLTGTRGVECRSGGSNGQFTMIFSFTTLLSSCGTASSGTVAAGPNPNQCTVNLSGVTNATYVTVTLNGVVSSTGGLGNNFTGTMGVLLGDVNGNGVVSNTDVSVVKGQVTAPVGAANFREDVNTNGVISNTDVSVTKAQVGTTLPSPP
jgi:hypothetical protein